VRQSFVAVCLALVGAAAASVSAESVVLVPSKDNTLIQWSAATEGANPLLSNGLGDVYVGRTNQDGQEEATISIRRGLVQFDIAGAVPGGMQITGATLTMRDVRGLNGDPQVRLHRVQQNWGEGSSFFEGGQGAPATDGDATWLHTHYNAANPAASATWVSPGGDYETIASAEATISDDLGGGQFFTWSSAAMVDDLRTWLQDPDENFGWIVLGDETRGQSAKRFNSHESTESPNARPMLDITFEPVFAGDYNDDGSVDAADYTVWRNSLGGAESLVNETVTLGSVTTEDYDVWKSSFGTMEVRTGSAAAVPEPATGGIAIVSATLMISLFNRSMHQLGVV